MQDSNNTLSVACHLMAQGRLTQTKWDRQIAQGLCLYCGGQGHKASEYSKVWKVQETSRRAEQSSEATVTPLGSSTMPVEPKITVIPENWLAVHLFIRCITRTAQVHILQHLLPFQTKTLSSFPFSSAPKVSTYCWTPVPLTVLFPPISSLEITSPLAHYLLPSTSVYLMEPYKLSPSHSLLNSGCLAPMEFCMCPHDF
jgi:hypothetical protein